MYKVICKINSNNSNNIELIDDKKISFSKKTESNNIFLTKDYILDYFYDSSNKNLINNDINPLLDDKLQVFLYGSNIKHILNTLLGTKKDVGILETLMNKLYYYAELEFIEVNQDGVYNLDESFVDVFLHDDNIKFYNSSKYYIDNKNEYLKFRNRLDKNLKEDSLSHKLIKIKNNKLEYVIVVLGYSTPIRRINDIKNSNLFINFTISSLKKLFLNEEENKKNIFISIIDKNIKNNYKSILISHIEDGTNNQNNSWSTLEFTNKIYNKNNSIYSNNIKIITKKLELDYKKINTIKPKLFKKPKKKLKPLNNLPPNLPRLPPPILLPPRLPPPRLPPTKISPVNSINLTKPKIIIKTLSLISKDNKIIKKPLTPENIKKPITPKTVVSEPCSPESYYKEYIKKKLDDIDNINSYYVNKNLEDNVKIYDDFDDDFDDDFEDDYYDYYDNYDDNDNLEDDYDNYDDNDILEDDYDDINDDKLNLIKYKNQKLIPFKSNINLEKPKLLKTINTLLYQRCIQNFSSLNKINNNKNDTDHEYKELILKTKATLEVMLKELDNMI